MPSPIPEAGVGSQTTVTAPSNANSVGAGTGGQVRMPRTPGVGAEPGLRARSTTTLPISAPITITVPTPPPQLPESTPVGTAPSANHIWVPGHPVWNGQWTTTEGQWALPPAPGATWVDGNYDTSTRAWRSGHWSTNPPPASR